MAIHVFYANRHYATVKSKEEYKELNLVGNSEMYNGAFIFWQPYESHKGIWYRPDFIPCMPSDITEELKGYLLLLGAF